MINWEYILILLISDICVKLTIKKGCALKDGYWQVELDDASDDVCTFDTPFGRCQFLILPFGIRSAPEVF